MMTHADLVKVAVGWLLTRKGNCNVAFSEFETWARERPDAIGFKNIKSVLIECKVSRIDFMRDNGS